MTATAAVSSGASILSCGNFALGRTFGQVWRHFFFHFHFPITAPSRWYFTLVSGVQSCGQIDTCWETALTVTGVGAMGEQRPGMLLNIYKAQDSPPATN